MDATETLKRLSGRSFEVRFLSSMIEHHKGGIAMSRQALEHARRPDTKAMARKIIDTQSKEIAKMASMLRRWYGRGAEPESQRKVRIEHMPMMAAYRQDCARDCDDAFPNAMKQHHETGALMAGLAAEKGVHRELRALGNKMAGDQVADIRRFNAMIARESGLPSGRFGASDAPSGQEDHSDH
jgi:uncharacterized protein (DUF305 family)